MSTKQHVWLFALVAGAGVIAWGQIGASPKEASPELYRQMQQAAVHKAPNLDQMVAQHDAIRHEATRVAAQLVVLISQMDALSVDMTKLKALVAEKDMSRVALLEERVKSAEDEKTNDEKERRAFWAEVMLWIRPTAVGVLIMALGGIYRIWVTRSENLAHAAQVQTVHAEVQAVQGSIKVLKEQTDGMTNNIERLATDKGINIGRAEADTTNAQVAEMLKKEKTDLDSKRS